MLHDEKTLEQIIASAPKKKNGTLHANRVTQIATLFCMENDATMYVLCAIAKNDTYIQLDIRKVVTTSVEKAESDVSTRSNLFRNL